MPSEWNHLEPSTPYISNNVQDMALDLKNEDIFLHQFGEEMDELLPQNDLFETKMCIDNNFFDSLLEEGNGCQWPDVLSQFPHIKDEDSNIIPIKIENCNQEKYVLSPSASVGSLSSSSESSNSTENKFNLETPPVSPPVNDVTLRTLDSDFISITTTSALPTNKSTMLRLNPNSIKIIQNTKGLKPVGKQTQVVLPKEILQKAIRLGPKRNITETSKVNSVSNGTTNLGCNTPILLPSSSQFGGSPTITVIQSDVKNEKTTAASSSQIVNTSAPTKPHILPLIKDDCDLLIKNELNMKALKRQQRMIKNRESACLSRKKKKEYVTSLESRISDLEHENITLKMENDLLKSRIKELETGYRNSGGKGQFLNTNLRKSVAVLAVVLMVSVNIGSLSMLSREGHRARQLRMDNDVDQSESGRVLRHGRSLLWTPPDLTQSYTNKSMSPGKSKSYSTCPLFINQTESLRLEKELRQWIAVDEKRGRYRNSTRRPATYQSQQQQLILQKPNNKVNIAQKMQRKTLSAVDIYQPPFPESLPRKKDTFYVFSFSSDHLLVPAVTHNNTLRPKMSFVIPIVPLNDSFLTNGSIPMMQIDCEVLATRSIEFSEKDFRNFKPKQEVSRKGNGTAPVSMRSSSYRPYYMQRRRVRPNAEFDDGFEGYMNRIYQATNTFP